MKDIQYYRVMKWLSRNGDQTHRLNYALNESSIVVDAGGYLGNFSAALSDMYNPSIIIFEPVEIYAERLRERFSSNSKISIFPYALGNEDREISFNVSDDASSAYKVDSSAVKVGEVDTCRFFEKIGLEKIDLLKINVEGYEYEIIGNLHRGDYLRRIDNIQVQFHDFVNEAEAKLAEARSILQLTHCPTYAFKFVWENWTKLDSNPLWPSYMNNCLELAEIREDMARLEQKFEKFANERDAPGK